MERICQKEMVKDMFEKTIKNLFSHPWTKNSIAEGSKVGSGRREANHRMGHLAPT